MNKHEALLYAYLSSWIPLVILLGYAPIVFIVLAVGLGIVAIPLAVWSYVKDIKSVKLGRYD